jgi:glycosyltransferase involved in cell wall biosynthesis
MRAKQAKPVLRRGVSRLARARASVRVRRRDRAAIERLRSGGAPRVLVLDVAVPAHDRSAGGIRMTWILRLLRSLGCQVTLFPVQQRGPSEPYATELRRLGVEVDLGPRSFVSFAATRAGCYDLVVMSSPDSADFTMGPARRAFPTAGIVYDTVDLHFVRVARGIEFSGDPSHVGYWRAKELEAFRGSDVVATVTEAEADVVRSMVPGARTVLLPTVHEPDGADRIPFAQTRDLLFIGGFLHQPNADAVRWFVREVLPLIRGQIDARLVVIGADPPPEIRALESPEVVLAGYVPHVESHFRRARVFVSPLRFGAGMKGKNGQAMAFGLPLVTTTMGADGMDLVDGEHALVRDGAEAFAAGVVELYLDPELWQRLSRQSQALVRERWSPDVMRKRLEALVSAAVAGPATDR